MRLQQQTGQVRPMLRPACLTPGHAVQEGMPPGTCHPDPGSHAHMTRAVSEAALYRQLTHLHRQLDVPGALQRARSSLKASDLMRCG